MFASPPHAYGSPLSAFVLKQRTLRVIKSYIHPENISLARPRCSPRPPLCSCIFHTPLFTLCLLQGHDAATTYRCSSADEQLWTPITPPERAVHSVIPEHSSACLRLVPGTVLRRRGRGHCDGVLYAIADTLEDVVRRLWNAGRMGCWVRRRGRDKAGGREECFGVGKERCLDGHGCCCFGRLLERLERRGGGRCDSGEFWAGERRDLFSGGGEAIACESEDHDATR